MPYDSCENCHKGSQAGKPKTYPVLIDENMETWMCLLCIAICEAEVPIEILEQSLPVT